MGAVALCETKGLDSAAGCFILHQFVSPSESILSRRVEGRHMGALTWKEMKYEVWSKSAWHEADICGATPVKRHW